MPLSYRKPSAALADELTEVSVAARELLAVLGERANIALPDDFPKDQLSDICRSLLQLPNGTAEGCRAPLEYARDRLPMVRREHIRIESKSLIGAELKLTRGTLVDVKLGNLISAVSTAWDEYKREAVEDQEPDLPLEKGSSIGTASVRSALAQGQALDQSVSDAQAEIKSVSIAGSENAEDVTRQLEDVRGLNRMGTAEMRMPKAFAGLLRRTSTAMKSYPRVIKSTVDRMQRGVDVTHLLWKRYDEFKSNGIEFVFQEIRKTLAIVEPAIEILEGKQSGVEPEEFSSTIEACLYVLRKNGGAMTAKSIFHELEKNPKSRKLIRNYPKTKPYGRITGILMKRRDRVGDVQSIGAGFWSASISKGELTKLKKSRSKEGDSKDGMSHSEKTKRGMAKLREKGRRVGPPPALTEKQVIEIIKILEMRRGDRAAVKETAKQFKVSPVTLREHVLRASGRKLWRKGPWSK